MSTISPITLLESYSPDVGLFDEFVDGDGRPRSHWSELSGALERLGHLELVRRRAETARALEHDGVTYNVMAGDEWQRRPWSLDPLPVVIPATEWSQLERGIAQRSMLLDLVFQDLYGERKLLADGSIPPELILSDPAFLRPCEGIRIPGPSQLFTLAIDLTRDQSGNWIVLTDRTQAPSGSGYAMENRTVISQVFPRIFRDTGVNRLAPYFRTLRSGLQAVAPEGTPDPRAVVLSPGAHSETAFEHAFLAAQLGAPLVEGSDLVVRDGRVWLRTVGRLRPVDVILRRVDESFCDPLELRPDSELGVPGLVQAARDGTVTVVNPMGSGILENAGLGVVLPRLARALLGEELLLPSAESWWCGDASSKSHVLANLESLVIRPTSRAWGATTFGHMLSAKEREGLSRRITAQPHKWVAQQDVPGSTAPVLTNGGLAPRRSVLRTFAVAADGAYTVMTGGLTRVARDPDSVVVSNQVGAISKDTWVLATEPESLGAFWMGSAPVEPQTPGVDPASMLSARAAENLFWLGRYAERAESAARLLRAANTRRIEFEHSRPGPGVEAMRALMITLTGVTATYPGFLGDNADALLEDPETELLSLLVDLRRSGTVANSVQRLIGASEAVRDQLSLDTFLVVGGIERELTELAMSSERQEDAIQWTLGRALQSFLALSGLGSDSMVRDNAWQFLEAGRRIERSLQVMSLVGSALGEERGRPTDSLVLESVLTAAESIITYRRRYQGRARAETVLDLLLHDETNPRSVRFQLVLLEQHLVALSGPEVESEALTKARQAIALLGSGLSIQLVTADPIDQRRNDLEDFCQQMRVLLHEIAVAVDAECFGHLLPQRSVRTPADAGGWRSPLLPGATGQ